MEDKEYNKNTLEQINQLQEELLMIKLQDDVPPSSIREIQQRLDKLIVKIKSNDKN
tara:strand:- start:520 stop:687 length:168 start_codon:yes stop_codon:yes gene_type:complete